MLPLDDVEAADPRADVDARALGQLPGEHEAGVLHGEVGGRQGEDDEAAHLLQLFLLDELEGVEVLDFAGEAAGVLRGVKEGDGGDAAAAGADRLPDFFGADAHAAEQADAGDHDPTAAHRRTPAPPKRNRLAGGANTG